MIIIPPVEIDVDRAMLFVPILKDFSSNGDFARFIWNEKESAESFIKIYSNSDSCFLTEKEKNIIRHFKEKLAVSVYPVVDLGGFSYYLICFGALESIKDQGMLFCVPCHIFNLVQVFKYLDA